MFYNKKPLNIRYNYPLGYTTQDLQSFINQLLSQSKYSKKRVAFIFPLAKARYYPLLSKLNSSNYYNSKKERQEHREHSHQLGIKYKKDYKRLKTPKFIQPINIINLNPRDNLKWEVTKGEAEVLSIYYQWKKCQEAYKL